jgi:hypothetical protein
MTNSELPSDYEAFDEILSSGKLNEEQISQILDKHLIWGHDCDWLCKQFSEEDGDILPESVMLKYGETFTLAQRRQIFDNREKIWLPEHHYSTAYYWGLVIDVAIGPSADLSLLQDAAWSYESYINASPWPPEEDTREYVFKFAAHRECTEEVIRSLLFDFHGCDSDKINETCEDKEFEDCDFCQDLLKDAVEKLNR